MPCDCVVQLDPKKPISPTKKHKLAKHTGSLTFEPKYAKKPQCKAVAGANCLIDVKYKWTLSKKVFSDKLVLFQEDEQECLVVEAGEFDLQVDVKVTCFDMQEVEGEDDGDSDVDVAITTTCGDSGTTTFVIRS